MVTINPLLELGKNLEWENRTLTLILPLRKEHQINATQHFTFLA